MTLSLPSRSPFARAGLYALAWVPYGIAISTFYAVWSGEPLYQVLPGGFQNAARAGILGLGILWVCRKLSWQALHPALFLGAHLLLAGVYAAGLMLSSVGYNALSVVTGLSEPGPLVPEWRLVAWQMLIGSLLYVCAASLCYVLQFATRLQVERARAARAEALKAKAELAALRARLNPHFLFNTLHSLQALVRRDAGAAERALEQFGDLLRYAQEAQSQPGDTVTLGEEWAFVRSYVGLESMRLGERLRIREALDPESLDCLVPTFSLQCLVENAVLHAAAPRARGATVHIRSRVQDGRLLLEVEDDGPGPSPASAGRGTGLAVLRQRLEVLYGKRGVLTLAAGDGGGFRAAVSVPARPGAPGRSEEAAG